MVWLGAGQFQWSIGTNGTIGTNKKWCHSKNEAPIANEAPKTRNHCRLNNYNFTSSMTQFEPGGGSGCVRASKGRQNPSQGFIKACQLFNWTFLDRISCINFIISRRVAILDTSYLNMHFFFGTHTCLCRLQIWRYFDVCKYARALTKKVWNEFQNGQWGSRVRLLRYRAWFLLY